LPRAVPFVGRDADRAAIDAWFESGARLVTVVGPGGIGKTALAAEHASALATTRGPSAVIACDVCDVRDVAELVDALALACGAPVPAGADGVAHVGAALAARGEVRVVVDDFDALVPHAGATLGAWLRQAPELEVLVTSRERLGLAAEVVHELGPLGDEALDLLTAVARRGAAGFELRPEDAVHARGIAMLVEGIPLGLEIAAARLPVLGARALHERLRAKTEPLRRASADGAARHASLDDAVAGSFAELGASERDVLAALTVFRGGFTVEAAMAVAGAWGDESALAALRARSLLRTRDASAARFDLYASVRAYVSRAHPAPIATAAERHAAYFVDAAERAAEIAHRDRAARAWLVAERANVLAVVERVLGTGAVTARAAEPALRGLVALAPLLLASGPLSGVAALVAPVVERTRDSGVDPRLSARVLLLRGALRRDEHGDAPAALRDLLAAESMARAMRDALLEADIAVELGRTVLSAREAEAALRLFEKACDAFAAVGARAREANALRFRARAHRAASAIDDAAVRRTWLERAVALTTGEGALAGPLLCELGAELSARGDDPARARAVLEESTAIALREGDLLLASEARRELGAALLGAARDPASLDAAEQALSAARDGFELLGRELDAAVTRGHLGLVARARGREGEAYALLAHARDAAMHAGLSSVAARFEAALGAAAPTGASAAAREDALVVGESGRWFRPPGGARVGLERRKNLARLVDHLAGMAVAQPGVTTTSLALFAVGCPGERAAAAAAAHRVRVALATLRKMGLKEHLVTRGDGYALAVGLPVVRV